MEPTPPTDAATAPVDPVTPAITDQLHAVAVARASRDALVAQFTRAHQRFEADNAELQAAIKASAQKVVALEDAVRSTARAQFDKDQDKQPIAGVSVRVETSLAYNPVEAFAWAKQTGLCLQLDVKGFEATAKANQLGFVKITKEPHVTLSKDLGGYLKGAVAAAAADAPQS